VVYDGRKLGPWLKKLRPPMQEFNAPMGMMLGPLDLMNVMQATRSWPAFVYSVKLGARFVWDKLIHGRGTRLTMGNALAARLLRSTVDAGVTLWDSSPALKLVKNGNLVTGAVIKHEGREVIVHARRGVVIATGGFSHDPEFRQQYFPFPEQHQTIVAEGATGDGLRMAFEAGAVMDRANRRNIFGVVVSLLKKNDGSVIRCPHFFSDLPKPGCIAVNRSGKRFGNEANLELPFAMQETGSVPAWLICDSKFIYKHGLGLVWPWGIRKGMMRRAGYLIEAPTLRALAQKLGIDVDEFEKTVAANNEYAKTGVDVEFRRGQRDLDRSLGDPTRKPNPCLGPIETAPFYAVQVFPGDVSSTAGLLTDINGQALDAKGAPIPGLYASGNDANSLWAGNGISNGVYNGPNLTFGYIIGRHLAQKNDE
jgi:succinate dehydrogenase/fumarate reductase flavoprotein subunit